MSLSLLDNGLDFLQKGLGELYGEDYHLRGGLAVDVDTRNYKYGVTNLFAGFLLLLKERLSRHKIELVFSGKLSDVKQKLKANKKTLVTVDLDEALERLEMGPNVSFSDDDLAVIKRIQDFRNQFEHFRVQANKYQLWAELAKFLGIVEAFLEKELAIDIYEYSDTTVAFHDKVQDIQEEVVRFDSAMEQQAYETLRQLSGLQVPGELLASELPVVLPTIQLGDEGMMSGDSRRFATDFVGQSEKGAWVIEIKGAYWKDGPRSALDLLRHARYSIGPGKAQAWLIVFANVPAEIKELARAEGIYLTDLDSWQSLTRL